MRHPVLIAALTLTTLWVGTALADDDCEAPMADWQPRSAVHQLAQSKGWTVQRIKVDDGCYEVKGRDANGQRIEAKIHPATLAVVELETDEEDDEGEKSEEEGAGNSFPGTQNSEGTAPTANPAPRNPLINGNSLPSGVVQ
ncbi:PepSY domain-containing protein [Dongia sp.]|uniref:PepSY domain-containing protein n=1 Tax=Dongia sp. TaxID=1977262 RepID=UPI0035B2D28C